MVSSVFRKTDVTSPFRDNRLVQCRSNVVLVVGINFQMTVNFSLVVHIVTSCKRTNSKFNLKEKKSSKFKMTHPATPRRLS